MICIVYTLTHKCCWNVCTSRTSLTCTPLVNWQGFLFISILGSQWLVTTWFLMHVQNFVFCFANFDVEASTANFIADKRPLHLSLYETWKSTFTCLWCFNMQWLYCTVKSFPFSWQTMLWCRWCSQDSLVMISEIPVDLSVTSKHVLTPYVFYSRLSWAEMSKVSERDS